MSVCIEGALWAWHVAIRLRSRRHSRVQFTEAIVLIVAAWRRHESLLPYVVCNIGSFDGEQQGLLRESTAGILK